MICHALLWQFRRHPDLLRSLGWQRITKYGIVCLFWLCIPPCVHYKDVHHCFNFNLIVVVFLLLCSHTACRILVRHFCYWSSICPSSLCHPLFVVWGCNCLEAAVACYEAWNWWRKILVHHQLCLASTNSLSACIRQWIDWHQLLHPGMHWTRIGWCWGTSWRCEDAETANSAAGPVLLNVMSSCGAHYTDFHLVYTLLDMGLLDVVSLPNSWDSPCKRRGRYKPFFGTTGSSRGTIELTVISKIKNLMEMKRIYHHLVRWSCGLVEDASLA